MKKLILKLIKQYLISELTNKFTQLEMQASLKDNNVDLTSVTYVRIKVLSFVQKL